MLSNKKYLLFSYSHRLSDFIISHFGANCKKKWSIRFANMKHKPASCMKRRARAMKRSAMLLFRVAKPRFTGRSPASFFMHRRCASFPNKRALLSQCSFVWRCWQKRWQLFFIISILFFIFNLLQKINNNTLAANTSSMEQTLKANGISIVHKSKKVIMQLNNKHNVAISGITLSFFISPPPF